MLSIVVVALILAFFGWLMGFGREQRQVAPEDDVTTPIDEAALEEAEQELAEAEETRSIDEDSDDDWGPGTGRSALPGII